MKTEKQRRVKKIVGIALGVILGLILVIGICGWFMLGTFIKAANTIEKLEDGLYCMEYIGDYGFDEFLANGGAASDNAVASYLTGYLSHGFYKADSETNANTYGCSTICVNKKDDIVLFGRNFDWNVGDVMLVHTVPKNGYESTTTCALDFLGFGEDYDPEGSMGNRFMSLAAIYVPLDGMNEKGLMIADLVAGDDEQTHQNTGKTNLTTTTAIRLVLDRAATVDEAIALLKQYDMNSSAGIAHHFAIADASGKSVVIEYVDGKMLVKETNIVTNHYLNDCDKKGIGSEQSHKRFDILSGYRGFADEQTVAGYMKSVAQMNFSKSDGSYERTLWTVVYNPMGQCADFYHLENYEHRFGILLHEKGSYVKR